MADTQAPPLASSLAGAPPACYIAAPSAVYLTGEEFLQLSSLANAAGVTLTVAGRVLRPDNTISRIQFTHAPNSNRTIATQRVGLPEGWLLGLRVTASAGTPAAGAVWVNLELVLGNTGATLTDQTLGFGFVTANTPFAFPLSVNTLPLEGPGNLRSITGTTPGAGVEISETVPTGARWQILAFRAQLLTAIAAANRAPTLTLDDGANLYHQANQGAPVPASTLSSLSWGPGAGVNTGGNTSILTAGLPVDIRMGAGHRLRTVTANIQAADQYSAVQYLVREWMTGE